MSHPSQVVHRHITGLDGLRGFAFLMVFTYHYLKSTHSHSVLAHATLFLASGGWMGVDLFFVLSGFLITGILLDTRDRPGYFRNFYARRALRIFPLFYGVFLLLLLLTPVLHLQWRLGHIFYPLYLGNFAAVYDFTLNTVWPSVSFTHLWSLAVEEQFYFIWPLAILAVRSRRHLLGLCAGIVAGSALLRTLLLLHFGPRAFEACYMLLPMRADGLVCGAVAAILYRKYDIRTLVRGSRLLLLASGAAAFFLFASTRMLDYHFIRFSIFGYPLLAIFSTCLLLRFASPRHVLAKLGSLGLLRFFGKYSYGMYVFHELFRPAATPLLRVLQRATGSEQAGAVFYFFLTLALVSIVSVLSFRFYEIRWLRLKSLFEYPDPGTPAIAAAGQSEPAAAG